MLAKDKDLLGKLIDIGALGATNYTHVYDPGSQSFDGRFSENNITSTPALFVCSVLGSVGVNAEPVHRHAEGLRPGQGQAPDRALTAASAARRQTPSLGGLLGVGK